MVGSPVFRIGQTGDRRTSLEASVERTDLLRSMVILLAEIEGQLLCSREKMKGGCRDKYLVKHLTVKPTKSLICRAVNANNIAESSNQQSIAERLQSAHLELSLGTERAYNGIPEHKPPDGTLRETEPGRHEHSPRCQLLRQKSTSQPSSRNSSNWRNSSQRIPSAHHLNSQAVSLPKTR